MAEILKTTRLGNPVLRETAKRLSVKEIKSPTIQTLIKNMFYTLEKENYGVGIAAPQVGVSVALSVVGIKPTPNRPDLTPFSTVLINPEIIETIGQPTPKWEACISCGEGDNLLYGRVPRYDEIKLRWLDETGAKRQEILGGFVAQVAQHETDHLNGIIFIDQVTDPTTLMLGDEYRLRVVNKS